MKLKERYIFVCLNRRTDGHPKGCCSSAGSEEVRARLKELTHERDISHRIRVVGSTCLGLCVGRVVMVVYPDNVWYSGVGIEDLDEVVDEHLIGGRVVERLRLKEQ